METRKFELVQTQLRFHVDIRCNLSCQFLPIYAAFGVGRNFATGGLFRDSYIHKCPAYELDAACTLEKRFIVGNRSTRLSGATIGNHVMIPSRG
jgi:hypothetical protein